MLIFCRKPGEKFRIGDDIVVTIERIRGQRVWVSLKPRRPCVLNGLKTPSRLRGAAPYRFPSAGPLDPPRALAGGLSRR